MRVFPQWEDDNNWKIEDDEESPKFGQWVAKSRAYDIALLTLDRNIGDQVGHFKISSPSDEQLAAGETIYTAGYPGIFPGGTKANPFKYDWGGGRIANMFESSGVTTNKFSSTNIFRYGNTVDTRRGQSGSPVWIEDSSSGQPTIIGVHVFGANAANGASRITSNKITKINEWIEADNKNNDLKPKDLPDLVPTEGYFAGRQTSIYKGSDRTLNFAQGDDIKISTSFFNTGTKAPTTPPTISFYLSKDFKRNWSTSDISSLTKLGQINVPSSSSPLSPYQRKKISWEGTVPEINNGKYYIVAYVDSSEKVAEIKGDGDSFFFDEPNNNNIEVIRRISVNGGEIREESLSVVDYLRKFFDSIGSWFISSEGEEESFVPQSIDTIFPFINPNFIDDEQLGWIVELNNNLGSISPFALSADELFNELNRVINPLGLFVHKITENNNEIVLL